MARTDRDSVKQTGAGPGDILVGYRNSNFGLRVRIALGQPSGRGGPVTGLIEILDAGSGTYSSIFAEFVGRPCRAEEVIDHARSSGSKLTHSFNANCLKLEPRGLPAAPVRDDSYLDIVVKLLLLFAVLGLLALLSWGVKRGLD